MRQLLLLLVFLASKNLLFAQSPCHIYDLTAQVVDCANGQFFAVLDFEHENTGNDGFKVVGNGQVYGTFQYNQLPITLGPLPGTGNVQYSFLVKDVQFPDCADDVSLGAVNCGTPPPACEIYDLSATVGDCNDDGTYHLTINFQVENPTSDSFQVWAQGGVFLGTFALDSLPLHIAHFPSDGGTNDAVKVCMKDNTACCRVKEFPAPDCDGGDCEISNLTVETGDCNADGTYNLWLNFQVAHPPTAHFKVWANGQFLGTFPLSGLPLHIPHFPTDGGANDVVKVCIVDAPDCCAVKEFPAPNCGDDCAITNLVVEVGDCNDDGTYHLWLNFQATNPGNDFFEVWANNGQYLGFFPLDSLPLHIPHFPTDGGTNDVVKICINDVPNCCALKEFPAPDCDGGGDCEISNLTVEVGDCNSDGTYNLWLNFHVDNPPTGSFKVWANNGQSLGIFPLSGLPLHIPHFPTDGGANDVVKICIVDAPDCCAVKEFPAPDCSGDDCEITNLMVAAGDCNADGTYHLLLHFGVANPGNATHFKVWANGQAFGTFPLTSLPLLIPNFPSDGGANDVVKVCILDNPNCCAVKEFPVPDCVGGDCEISNLVGLRTPCLCGQFFVGLAFLHDNGGSGGFDIVGNGNFYGTFPYSTPQPIILGPLEGNGTNYEFVVKDHNHPADCFDVFMLGPVSCPPLVGASDEERAARLTISPNPANDWLQIAAQTHDGSRLGQADAAVYATDGRLLRSETVAEGSQFSLDVSALPAGVYRLRVIGASGAFEGSFVKQ